MTERHDSEPVDLGVLTGVRSGKRTFYPEYVRSTERLTSAVQALDGISRALVRNVEGPRALVEEVVAAAADHLQADRLLLAVADGVLRSVQPGFLLIDNGRFVDQERELPAAVVEQLEVVRSRPWETELVSRGPGWVRAPMILDGEPVGGIVGWPGEDVLLDPTDLAVLRVLANQAAVALYNSDLLHATTQLRGRTVQLSQETERQAKDLAVRSAELQQTQRRLMEALQHQALDDERHRIARELHDSVTQYVLSAGMTIEVCRAELAELGERSEDMVRRLAGAKDMTRHAVEQLRASIYSLHRTADDSSGSLHDLLRQLSSVHAPGDLDVQVRVAGAPAQLPLRAEHAMLRIAGEALFNVVAHACATRAVVRLRYTASKVSLSVADDGHGDPVQMRQKLRVTSAADLDGKHRGLANMAERAESLGGGLTIRKARLGGVEIRVEVPLSHTADPAKEAS
jgi:signal transduction histidine kinase